MGLQAAFSGGNSYSPLLTPYSPLTHPPKWCFIRKFTVFPAFFKILLTLLTSKLVENFWGYTYTHPPYIQRPPAGVSRVSKISWNAENNVFLRIKREMAR